MHVNQEIIELVEETSASIRQLLSDGKTTEAIDRIAELIAIDPDDINVGICAASHLIDAAGIIQDISLADRGAEIIENILGADVNISESTEIQFHYNLSNAYGVKYAYHRTKGKSSKADQNLQKQKELLQRALIRREHIPAELKPAILTNYANTLDHLNRTFEAVDHYMDCLRAEPDHGLARGNCAVTMRRVLAFSDQHRLSNLQSCWDLLSDAVANRAGILKWAEPGAMDHLVKWHLQLRSEIEIGLAKGMATLEEFSRHRLVDHPKDPGPEWVEQLRQDRLLLTFNLIPIRSVHELMDDAIFDQLSYGLDDRDRSRSVSLIDLFNSIKEEFVTARYLYYQVDNREEMLRRCNDISLFGDPDGDAEFGLISGLLKASLRSTVDLLDKIAVFLALYFQLSDPIDKYNFTNVWFEKRNIEKGIIHPTVEAAFEDNYPLMGLRDLQLDFVRQAYPGPIKKTRNAAVHRSVRLSWLSGQINTNDGTLWNLEDFTGLTFFMLRQAKAAILLLAAAVNVEERKRRVGATAPRGILPVPLLVQKPISARAAEEVDELRPRAGVPRKLPSDL